MDNESTATTERRAKPERRRLKPGEPFDTCVGCGHDQGFHIAVIRGRRGTRAGQATLLLKCPQCGVLYDAGLAAVAE